MGDAVSDKGKQQALAAPVPVPVAVPVAVVGEKDVRAQPNCVPYPRPLAKYEDVVASPKLFMETLEKLHSVMATKFMVPTIGGRELNLHQLFVEVTSRGGIEKVIGDRRWREVTAAFSFPSTATNASFVLRKYYMSLLHHYEQIYFFGSLGWVPALTGFFMKYYWLFRLLFLCLVILLCTTASNAISSASAPSQRVLEPMTLLRENQSGIQKRRKSNGDFAFAGPPLPENPQVFGVIDGKFEHGYLGTVTIGREKLRGILYHTPDQTATQSGVLDNNSVRGVRRRRRKKKLSKRDPTHPKPNRSGYNFFFAEQHARLKPLHPGKDREISKMIGDLWNKLTETVKSVYQERGVKDKERYKSEMAVYRERLKGQVISNAIPIQQRPAEPDVMLGGASSKMEVDEGGLPLSNQMDSSSDGSDSEGKFSCDDSETETSPELVATAADSTSLVAEVSADKDAFELRKRDDPKMETEQDCPSSSEDAESRKATDSPNNKQ